MPGDVSKDERAIEIRDRIAASTLNAGHLTTRQHAHFVFAITGVSRQCLWSFLHGHPFYNSEQVSQRYVRVKRGNFLMPPLTESAAKLYAETVDAQMADYERLIELLRAVLEVDYYDRFKSRRKDHQKWKGVIDKRAFEVARYVLGVGTTAYLYHTVSALTLLRYAKLCDAFDTPREQRVLVSKMIDCVKQLDPLFEKEISDPISLDRTLEYQMVAEQSHRAYNHNRNFIREFDDGLEGRTSKLVGHSADPEPLLAQAFRVMLGKTRSEMSDERALELLLDPKHNRILADTINLTPLDRLSQALRHVQFSFNKKISHTADSQDQRHRMVPASRPILMFHFTGDPDFVTPYGITQSEEAADRYRKSMDRSFAAVSKLIDMGVSEQDAFYLLPNAVSVRMVSTGDLQSLWHKWKLRSCYNAQEEIFRATIQEVEQVQARFPTLGKHLRAPCYVRMRAGVTPYCPEGDHYCGLPVWKYEISQYSRKSL
jgi:thymidylate synthase ThyX